MTETLEELEVIPATKSPHGYLASFLSDNIAEKDDGTLVVVGCPIARTGWQKYMVSDLPKKRAEDLGVDVSNPNATINLYRPASEVFHPEFLSSLNGCTITDGHPPGGEFVNPKNFNKYSQGHIQNVRKGTEPLEDGEWPIIADLVISAEPLISKVRNKEAREISLGYDFSIDRDGDKIIQCGMLGNHNAVVPKGRAGDLIRIEDVMPASLAEPPSLPSATTTVSKEVTASVDVIETVAYPLIAINFKPTKEKQSVAKPNKLLRLFMGKHLIEMARATDADPEKILEAAEALNDDAEPPKNTGENEFKSEDKKKGKDGELPEALKKHQFKAEDEEEEVMDRRKAAHDALDAILDRTNKQETGVPAKDRKKAKDKRSKDADIEELKELLTEYLDEEEDEPEHAEDRKRGKDDDDDDEEVDSTELESLLSDKEELEEELDEVEEEIDELEDDEEATDAEECPDCGEAHDSEECPGQKQGVSGEENIKAKDRARAADGASAVLRMLRPVVARTGDKAVQSAFNRALDSVKKSSRVSTSSGGYGKFASASRARDKAPNDPGRSRAADSSNDTTSKLQAAYNTAFKGGK